MRKILSICYIVIIIFIMNGCKHDNKEDQYDYDKVEVEIKNGEFLLDGELLLPETEDKIPAVVIVAGSGPTDMDGSINAQKPYKELAVNLAKKGIASIRFNKVTFQYNTQIAKDYGFSIEDEYINSIESAVDKLKKHEEIDSSKIYLIGHSLGAQMIPIILDNDSSLAGGIIMAGTTMHILEILLEQVKKQNEEQYNEWLPFCEYAKSLTEVPDGEEQYYYFGAYTAYYVSYNKVNLNLVKDLNCPLLIMQGELDLQVTMDHFDNYKELLKDNDNVSYKQYPLLNHLFSNGEGENVDNAYMRKKPISEDVINDIYDFIKGE